ncbi:MAG: hypothetical protein IPH74_00360 [Bacteroidetes bacterium]|nr:hypothetical protein [Bacteroidota bacterium]
MKIQIPIPCHENWDEMIPNEKGNFCKVCNKTVIDFTNMSEQELIAYFENKKPGATCGRLRADQLTKEEVIPTNWVNSFHVFVDKKINFQPFKRVAFLFLGIAVFFVSCIKKREIMGKIKVPKKDTLVDVEKWNNKTKGNRNITIDNKSSNLKMGKPAINASVGRIDTAN